MGDLLSFGIELVDGLSAPATAQERAVAKLRKELEQSKSALAGFEAQLAHANQLGDVAGHRQFEAAAAGAKSKIIELKSALASMPAPAEAASGAMGGLGSTLTTMGPALGAVGVGVGVVVGVLGAFVGVAERAVSISLEVVNANQQLVAGFEALGGAGDGTLAMLDGLAERLPQSRSQLATWTREIQKMGVTDLPELRAELLATASAQAVLGDSGAQSYEKLQRKVTDAVEAHHTLKIAAKELTKTIGVGVASDVAKKLGLSLGDLETKLKAGTIDARKFGDALRDSMTERGKGPLEAMSNSISAIGTKAHEAFSKLFDAVDTKPLTDALRSVVALGDAGNPAGEGLKMGITPAVNGIIKLLGHGIHEAEIFFLRVELGALTAYVAVKPLIPALSKIVGLMGDAAGIVGKVTAPTPQISAAPDVGSKAEAIGHIALKSFIAGPILGIPVLFNEALQQIGGDKAQQIAFAGGVASGKAAMAGLKAGTESHSPSRAAMRIGMDLSLGFGLGMTDSPAPERAAREISANALGGLAAPLAQRQISSNAFGPSARGNLGSGGDVAGEGSRPSITIGAVNVHAAAGVTDAHELSMTGLATALERGQLASGR